MSSIWEKPASHGEILKLIWKNLDLGVLDRNHPFHTPVFATTIDGEADLRVVVLRRFWRKPRGLAFHSHIGAQKISQIEGNNKVSWIFYHPKERFQVRIKGIATIHKDDELADEQWLATDFFSRRCYIGEAPSKIAEAATHGLPADLIERKPSPVESEMGRKNFVVISSSIDSMDIMELDIKGNRRSLFTWDKDGQLITNWLTP